MTKDLTPSVVKRITTDWQRSIPSLGVYRPMHLLRRAGPLLIGVCLERDSGGQKYKPCFHVHFLGKEFPVVSLTLRTQLRAASGGPDYVEVECHADRYQDAAARMLDQALLPLSGTITSNQVIDAYESYLQTPFGKLQRALLRSDLILFMLWCGNLKDAKSLLAEVLGEEESAFAQLGGRTRFEQHMDRVMAAPRTIEDVVSQQMSLLKTSDLPVSEIHVR